MCAGFIRCLLLSAVLLALALLFPADGWSAGPPAPQNLPRQIPKSIDTATPPETTEPKSVNFDELRKRIEEGLAASNSELQRSRQLLTEASNEISELRNSLDFTLTRLTSFEEKAAANELAAAEAKRETVKEKKRGDFWRIVAAIGWAAAVSFGVAAGLMAR